MDLNAWLKEFAKKYHWNEHTLAVALRARFKCEYCGLDFLASEQNYYLFERDHVLPESKGGEDKYDNLAASCRLCNTIKRAFMPPGVTREDRIKEAKIYIAKYREKRSNEVTEMRKRVEGFVWDAVDWGALEAHVRQIESKPEA
jgi:hypothetical protein